MATTTPLHDVARLIRDYAHWVLTDCMGTEEPAPAIATAIMESQSAEEAVHLGRALLCRAHSLSDAGYRPGERLCDPRLTAIVHVMGWTP